jgi:hypothetical protein
MRNKKIEARIQAALERSRARQNGAEVPKQVHQLDKVRCMVDRRINGERNWRIEEIADRENLSYMTVYRMLKGKPGWFQYGRAIRITDTLYRWWLASSQLAMSLDECLSLQEAV